MKYAFDIDEVLNDLVPDLISYVEKIEGKKINFEDIKTYNLWEHGIGKDKNEVSKIVNDFYHFHFKEKASDGAKEVIAEIISGGNDVVVITARPIDTKDKTEKFIRENFLGVSNIIYSGDFYGGGKTKGEIIEELGVEFMVEDNIDYARDCAKRGIKVFLLNKPWNQTEQDDENIIRINNLKEMLK